MMAEKVFLKQEQDDLHAVISILEGERDALKEQLEVDEGATRVNLDMTENNGKVKIATEISSACQLDELVRTVHSLNKQLELSTKESKKLLFQNEALLSVGTAEGCSCNKEIEACKECRHPYDGQSTG
jgi:hypothetical protein